MNQPLYQVILANLKEEILNGTLPIGAQLPTEKELSERYQVSRITSKRALTELEQAGLIERVRGKGSFVKAQTAVGPRSKRILFLLPFLNDLSLGDFTKGLLPVMQEQGFELMMTTPESLTTKRADELMAEYDGMIYYVSDEESHLDLLLELSLKQFPVILLDKKIYDVAFPTVSSDNREGGFLATELLIQQHHQQIAYLFGDLGHRPQSVRQRYLGYLQALDQAGLAFHSRLEAGMTVSEELPAYLAEHGITALVCENDLTAIAAARLLKKHGLQVPDDVSIIGFDDIQAARFVEPPLTTIAQNFDQLGQQAGEAMLQWLAGTQPTDTSLPVSLIIRQSTKELM